MIFFADEDLADPSDPFGYLAEDELWMVGGPPQDQDDDAAEVMEEAP